MSNIGVPGIILMIIVFVLIALFFVSFFAFISKLLKNSDKNRNQPDIDSRLTRIEDELRSINKKMDHRDS
ncbi:DUF4083 family protein [Peribacillus sp. NPDC097225]|uniref:DUF4083 family protein n=1 Tax=Peribacillus sp. NPDC097225 TaxID=3364400 RepID=UPI0037F5D779